MAYRTQARSIRRKQQIIEAALQCFGEFGFNATEIQEIGRRAGASIGSIYHQFKSKDGLAAAVYLEGLRRYQQGMTDEIRALHTAREGVRAVIHYHLRWTEANQVWARFLMDARRASFMQAVGDEVRNLNREFGRAMGDWLMPLTTMGQLREMPIDIFLAVLLGPCNEYVRGYLDGRAVASIRKAETLLFEAAWRALGTES